MKVGRPFKRYLDPEIAQRVEVMLERGLSPKNIIQNRLDRPMPRDSWWLLVKQVRKCQ